MISTKGTKISPSPCSGFPSRARKSTWAGGMLKVVGPSAGSAKPSAKKAAIGLSKRVRSLRGPADQGRLQIHSSLVGIVGETLTRIPTESHTTPVADSKRFLLV